MKNQNLVKNYNMFEIMSRAWVIFKAKDNTLTFGESLKKSWHIAKNGINNETFEQIYNNNYDNIYHYVFSKVKDIEISKDIIQEVFIRLHKHLGSYDYKKAKLNTWLHKIALNLVIDYVRSKANQNSLISISVNQCIDDDNKEYLQLPDNSINDNDIENNELLDSLGKAFEDLTPKYKQIAEMFFIHELSYKEIVNILNIPMGTVKGMINRCRAKLQDNLKDVRTKASVI